LPVGRYSGQKPGALNPDWEVLATKDLKKHFSGTKAVSFVGYTAFVSKCFY
jgi:hypothetical protein